MKLIEIHGVNPSTDYDDNDPLIVIMTRRLLNAGEKIHHEQMMFAELVKGFVTDIWMDRGELNVVFRYDKEYGAPMTGSSPTSLGNPEDFELTKVADGWRLHEAT